MTHFSTTRHTQTQQLHVFGRVGITQLLVLLFLTWDITKEGNWAHSPYLGGHNTVQIWTSFMQHRTEESM